MTAAALSPDAIAELRRRHVEFVQRRMTGDAAAREWRENLEATWGALLTRRIEELATVEGVLATIDAMLAPAAVTGGTRPLARALDGAIVAALRSDPNKVGAYVPEDARREIDALLERAGTVPEKLVRAVLEHEAMEEAMRDVLHDALASFNETVNPFFADWGLPALVKKLMPIGSGAVLKSLGTVRAEFDKRLDPEMKKFLQGASKRALKKLADVMARSGDDPKKGASVRKAVAAWAYDEELRAFAAHANPATADRVHGIVARIVLHSAALPASVERRHRAVKSFFEAHGGETLGGRLEALGVTARPDFDAIARATWPALATALGTEPVRAWLAAMTHEFYDEVTSG